MADDKAWTKEGIVPIDALGNRGNTLDEAKGTHGYPAFWMGENKRMPQSVLGNYHEKLKQDVANAALDKRHNLTTGTIQPYPPTLQDQDEQDIADLIMKNQGFVMEKPNGSCLHHALDELKAHGLPKVTHEFLGQHFQSFVVQHNWAAAFKGTRDFDAAGDIPLPFQFTAFEFRLSGLRTIVCLGAVDEEGKETIGLCLTGINNRWYVPVTRLQWKDGHLHDLHADGLESEGPSVHLGSDFISLLSSQIRAVCIMLDAEVAEAEVVWVSEKLNRNRAKMGRSALKNYHVVSLARKHRVKPVENSAPSDRRGPRLHWRRGHWRHFDTHRTWIRWMLVGDPDLGFVDKEYKL